MTKFPISTLLAAATFAGILLGIHYGFDPAKGMTFSELEPVMAFRLDRSAFVPVVGRPLPGVPATLAIADPDRPGWSAAAAANLTLATDYLVDGTGSLDHFYSALSDLSSGKRERPVRIVHYGDSPTTADLITGDARELLQARFGDAGPGFVLIAKPWAWYGHHGVEVAGTGWKIDTAVGSMREGTYGLGGAIFSGPVGAESTIRLDAKTSTTVEVEYLQQPGGGSVEVLADGASVGAVDTSGTDKGNGDATVALPAGSREVTLRVTDAPVQVFGVAFGTGHKGITYDSIGLNGASTTVMSRAFNAQEWGDALEHRDPDLVIINYGTNESSYPAYVDKQYEPELRRAIARVRTALPQASILVMSPMDRGAREGETISTMPAIPRLVEIQQRVAAELGCGFYNTYAAMGGEGTMERWYDGHPRMVAADLIHPTPQGARIVAQTLTGQLLIGYERYLQRHAQAAGAPKVANASNVPSAAARVEKPFADAAGRQRGSP
jgi:lysophospholipase L1-like esterase